MTFNHDNLDDGALSWDEFKSFFSDGVIGEEELKSLFADIDTHNTKYILYVHKHFSSL